MVDTNTRKLGNQLVQLCKQNDAEPSQYQQYLKKLIRKLSMNERPHGEAVLMYATHELYGLVSLS